MTEDPRTRTDGTPISPEPMLPGAAPPSPRVSFAGFVLDPTRRVLSKKGEEVKLRPQSFDVLAVLVENANNLVAKEALFETVWRGAKVTDDSLVQCIHELRAALGDTAQRLIRNVPRRGYLLAIEVTTEEVHTRLAPAGVQGDGVSSQPLRGRSSALVEVRRRRVRVAALALTALVAALVAVVWWRPAHRPNGVHPGALAVLPFHLLGPASEEDEILALGIADALIFKLSAVTRLTVRPTSAVIGVHGDGDALRSGRKLGVDYVLEGHLQRSGVALRVTAQLLSVESGASLWSDRFQVESGDLFRVQDAIAQSAAASLLERLSKDEHSALARRDTTVPEANLAYLRGRQLWARRTEAALLASVAQFQRALQLDPRYGLAAAGLADAYNLLGAYGSTLPRASFERALATARRALEMDDTLAEAHASLGFALAHHDHDWAHAEAEYRRALDLSPGYATALQWLALCLAAEGRFEEAIATSRRAVAADPLSPIIATDLGRHLYYARMYAQSIDQLRAAVDLDPTFARAHQELGRALRQYGQLDVAVSELSRAVALSDRSSAALAELASARAAAGDRPGAEELLAELSRRRASGTYVSGYHFAVAATALGDRERATRELWSAYQDCFNWIVFVAVEPQFDPLRGAKGFEQLVERLGVSLWEQGKRPSGGR
jgi:DNA-binding winged helix-turn-helix (wHTH) protein/TolB-like protein/Flp pilus assembly protein TadD